ncbi:hypothetical protein UFOVP225_32 [uncultured Caudovirales phage]|uniref:Collagen triple helix repeat n=1 Tax=uncultured Caudovirales phage TaxID=2100421 RepID=A0A6J5L598_9CAUD|nr:hypothetical protein UFOVP113_45 [uncultured Caudovirales phage]CAB5219162.1 hypothetical protein UFOVP225_32 [uncultured Caudovirales phage]
MVDVVVTPTPVVTVTVTPAITPVTPPTEVSVLEGQPGPKGEKGDTGATGATGPQGPSGITQAIAYTHTQNAVSSTWSITHDLGFKPNVTTTDSSGFIMEGTVNYTSATTLTINFGFGTTGFAYLS